MVVVASFMVNWKTNKTRQKHNFLKKKKKNIAQGLLEMSSFILLDDELRYLYDALMNVIKWQPGSPNGLSSTQIKNIRGNNKSSLVSNPKPNKFFFFCSLNQTWKFCNQYSDGGAICLISKNLSGHWERWHFNEC